MTELSRSKPLACTEQTMMVYLQDACLRWVAGAWVAGALVSFKLPLLLVVATRVCSFSMSVSGDKTLVKVFVKILFCEGNLESQKVLGTFQQDVKAC